MSNLDAAKAAAFDLVATALRSNDPEVPVLKYESTSWVEPNRSAVYVAVLAATLADDGRIDAQVILTALERSDVVALSVPQIVGQHREVSPGYRANENARPVPAYVAGGLVDRWSVHPGYGHASRSKLNVSGWLASAVQTWSQDDDEMVRSIRRTLHDLSNQQSWPDVVATAAVHCGASWHFEVNRTAANDFTVCVSARQWDPPADRKVEAANAAEYLKPHVGRLAIPAVGVLAGVTVTSGDQVSLTFDRPATQE